MPSPLRGSRPTTPARNSGTYLSRPGPRSSGRRRHTGRAAVPTAPGSRACRTAASAGRATRTAPARRPPATRPGRAAADSSRRARQAFRRPRPGSFALRRRRPAARHDDQRPCTARVAAPARRAPRPTGQARPGSPRSVHACGSVICPLNPVLVENSATGAELGFHSACRYSLISPASLARRWIWAGRDGEGDDVRGRHLVRAVPFPCPGGCGRCCSSRCIRTRTTPGCCSPTMSIRSVHSARAVRTKRSA